ncbi:MAG: Gfo/Idh/MocA family oxidoreductase [Deltaproteobacteria bacterium]|nr:Gfo/Idh/MocA family oxidoreductase [Deltaproteobacteria bacterium]
MKPLRLGILGAAQIAPMALIRPARQTPEVEIVAVAAREPQRARDFANKHGIGRVHANYAELIADPEIDAIYNPLPNSHHCEWTIRALEAGKHVLCEKPLAANADEAQTMAEAATRSQRVLMEAFHWRYHPLAARMREIVDSGELGTVHHIEVQFCIPLLRRGDIRYRLDLAGGAAMDVGCYAVNIVRHLAGAEPEVVSARAKLSSPGVDRVMTADLRWDDGRSGRIHCALLSPILLRIRAHVRGDRGEMRVFNPVAPQFFHRLSVRSETGKRSERVAGDASYSHQLRAFVSAVCDGQSFPSTPEDGVKNMRVIDAMYRKAGLSPRGVHP